MNVIEEPPVSGQPADSGPSAGSGASGGAPATRGNTERPDNAAVDYVVGIGSSAGGLESLQLVVRGLPTNLRVAYVVAQHVAPQHRSLMAELLDRETDLQVLPAEDGRLLEPGRIYVTPPNADVAIRGAHLRLQQPLPGHGPKPSIDGLFLSLAREWGAHSAAVLLSGTGNDGTYGMREVQASGGLTMAQEPATAKYESMPLAAIHAGVADLVVEPGEVGHAIERLCDPSTHTDQEPRSVPTTVLRQVVVELLTSAGVDFSEYKEGTIRRQIARRMSVLQLPEESDYLTYLKSNPPEARILCQALLVSVTSFYRDPTVWESLRAELQGRWADAPPDRAIRVWVPGCATGEEVYTVAMLISEVLGRPDDLARRVKIFGTDLDETALDFARRGSYPQQALAGLPQEWRDRYFSTAGTTAAVSADLREIAVFAKHNIAADPAFLRLDMISFRNVLIYFENSLQDRVLQSLHHALRPDGLLVLGASEGVSGAQEWFRPVLAKQRVFERLAGPSIHPGRAAGFTAPGPLVPKRTRRNDQGDQLQQSLLKALSPNTIVINESDRVVQIIGDVSDFAQLPSGEFDNSLQALMRPELYPDVRTLIIQVRAAAAPRRSEPLRILGGSVQVTGTPVVTALGNLVALSFVMDPTQLPEAPEAVSPEERSEISRLKRELRSTQQALQATIEELETSNEELQATNEELVASAEELQASNEELETTNEELQATNEELGTLNQELQVRQNELGLANDDLLNIQEALSQAIIIVDPRMRVTRYSPLAVRLFGLVEADIGRPLTAVPTSVRIPELGEALADVIETRQRKTLEVNGDHASHLLHMVPYRGVGGSVKGAIMSITDVSASAEVRRGLETTLADMRGMTEGLDELIWRREGTDGAVTFINRRVLDLFGLDQESAMADPRAMDGAINADDLARIDSLTSADRSRVLRYETEVGGRTHCLEDVVHQVVERPDGSKVSMGSIREITRRSAEDAGDRSGALRAILSLPHQLTMLLDASGRVIMAGDSAGDLLGISAGELAGRSWVSVIHELDVGVASRSLAAALAGVEAPAAELDGADQRKIRLLDRGGGVRWASLNVAGLDRESEDDPAAVVSFVDVTNQHEAQQDLSRRARYDFTTGLLNRAAAIEALGTELLRQSRRNRQTAVLWLDLDGFKEVNDRYGHSAGDAVLREIAERLQGSVRRQDIVGRLGGDEFLAIITDSEHPDGIESTADRILTKLSSPISWRNQTMEVSASIGIALAPTDGATATDVLHSADTAMYAAKKTGGGTFSYFHRELNAAAERRAETRLALAKSLRNREFLPHYQPILDLSSGELWGVEALCRWVRDGQVIPAADFIAIAEETGQIRGIGQLIAERAIADLPSIKTALRRRLPAHPEPQRPRARGQRVMESLLSQLQESTVENIVVEITETALVGPQSTGLAALRALTRLGVSLAIDDFGTGFSNLAALDQTRPALIKADAGFVALAATGDQRGETLLNVTTLLAESVGATTLAEGISDPAELRAAVACGIQLGQGYGLGMPMPLSALLEWQSGLSRLLAE